MSKSGFDVFLSKNASTGPFDVNMSVAPAGSPGAVVDETVKYYGSEKDLEVMKHIDADPAININGKMTTANGKRLEDIAYAVKFMSEYLPSESSVELSPIDDTDSPACKVLRVLHLPEGGDSKAAAVLIYTSKPLAVVKKKRSGDIPKSIKDLDVDERVLQSYVATDGNVSLGAGNIFIYLNAAAQTNEVFKQFNMTEDARAPHAQWAQLLYHRTSIANSIDLEAEGSLYLEPFETTKVVRPKDFVPFLGAIDGPGVGGFTSYQEFFLNAECKMRATKVMQHLWNKETSNGAFEHFDSDIIPFKKSVPFLTFQGSLDALRYFQRLPDILEVLNPPVGDITRYRGITSLHGQLNIYEWMNKGQPTRATYSSWVKAQEARALDNASGDEDGEEFSEESEEPKAKFPPPPKRNPNGSTGVAPPETVQAISKATAFALNKGKANSAKKAKAKEKAKEKAAFDAAKEKAAKVKADKDKALKVPNVEIDVMRAILEKKTPQEITNKNLSTSEQASLLHKVDNAIKFMKLEVKNEDDIPGRTIILLDALQTSICMGWSCGDSFKGTRQIKESLIVLEENGILNDEEAFAWKVK